MSGTKYFAVEELAGDIKIEPRSRSEALDESTFFTAPSADELKKHLRPEENEPANWAPAKSFKFGTPSRFVSGDPVGFDGTIIGRVQRAGDPHLRIKITEEVFCYKYIDIVGDVEGFDQHCLE